MAKSWERESKDLGGSRVGFAEVWLRGGVGVRLSRTEGKQTLLYKSVKGLLALHFGFLLKLEAVSCF